jgi:hypothetical protein
MLLPALGCDPGFHLSCSAAGNRRQRFVALASFQHWCQWARLAHTAPPSPAAALDALCRPGPGPGLALKLLLGYWWDSSSLRHPLLEPCLPCGATAAATRLAVAEYRLQSGPQNVSLCNIIEVNGGAAAITQLES